MKNLFVILFLSISSLVFGRNDVVDFNLMEIEVVVNNDDLIKNKAKIEEAKTLLAFEYYYTMDWLYSETPFSHKLEAYV